MFLISAIFVVVVFILIIVVCIYRQLSHRDWHRTDDSILKIALNRLKQDFMDVKALRLAGNVYYKKKNYEKSFEYYSKIIMLASSGIRNYLSVEERFQSYLEFGISAYHLKKLDDAMVSLKKARNCMPNAFNLFLSKILGMILFKKGQFSEAVVEMERVHKLR